MAKGAKPLKEYKKHILFRVPSQSDEEIESASHGVRKQLGNHKDGQVEVGKYFREIISTLKKNKRYNKEEIPLSEDLELSDEIYYLPLNAHHKKSGINSSQSKPRGKVIRNPYEVELSSPKNILSSRGICHLPSEFPQPSEEFWGIFDLEGIRHHVLCRRSGGAKQGESPEKRYKNIRSEDSKLLGYFIKGSLVLAGLIEAEKKQNDIVTPQILKQFGSDCLVFRKVIQKQDGLRQFYISFNASNGLFEKIQNEVVQSLEKLDG